ncbi:helix-turn-helix domain-containing protein [Vallitalea guaymasensis]|uniref:Helix-turn-helix transcriptional regulator n=1 Tax=Vallitalea guaymasensis TaxID=1185412 RepID=A0A8J8M7H1_9FIRM|nr:helix-turn-helix transcriptional regulator [Vallitalea guaymasensis]QUH27736.1 helix-turn-helix transcriptional regulator [Vallitalea guaymasensis]
MIFERIRNIREDNDLTQSQIAEFLNINQRTYSRYERGEISITVETLCKLADYYETSLDYLAGRTDIKTPYSLRK